MQPALTLVVNTATLKPGIDAAKTAIAGLGSSAAEQFNQANTATQKYAASLLRQAETLGKSRGELIAYNAQMRIGGELGAKIAARAREQQDALNKAAESAKALANGLSSAAFNDTQLLKANAALGAFKAKSEAAAAAAEKLKREALDSATFSDTQLLKMNNALGAYAAKANAAAEAARALAAAQQSEAAQAEGARRLQQEAALREKVFAQTAQQLQRQEVLNRMRQDAVAAFGPEFAAYEREQAEMQRSNAVRERLTAFLNTERGARIAEAEAVGKSAAGYAQAAKSTTQYSGAVGNGYKSTKELAFALRTLPAQFTDIAVSLQAGQRPLTVLLQQGGQLKDMFGGIGPAAKAMGGYLLGLINPLTLVAAAAVGLFLAWKQGSDELEGYNKALIATGGYAGVSGNQISDMAKEIAKGAETQHAAAAALTEVANAGKFVGDELRLVARASVDANRVLGQSVQTTVQQFESLKKDPVKAIQTLNDTQHFLTVATYEQIKALQDQGRQQEAVTLAEKTYSAALSERAKEVQANTGYLEKAWHGVASAAKGAWDAMLDVGREQSLSDKIEAANKQLQELMKGSANVGSSSNFIGGLAPTFTPPTSGENDPRIQQLRKYISGLYDQAEKEQKDARQKYLNAQLAQDKADSDREVEQFAQNYQKRATEIAKVQGEYTERIARATAAGDTALVEKLRAAEKLVIAGINEKFKDPKKAIDPAISALKKFQDYVNGLSVKSISVDDAALTKYEQGIAKLALEMNDYVAKTHDATGAAKLFNDGQRQLAAQLAQDKKKQKDAEDAYAFSLSKSNDALREQVNDEIARIGQGAKEFERAQKVTQVYRDQAQALTELALKRQQGVNGESGGLTAEQYQADVANLQKATDEKVRILKDGFKRQDAAQSDWLNGAKAAYQDYVDQAANVAGQTYDLFTNAFTSMGDALANFVTTGKLDFKGLVVSILSDLAKMEARILASKVLQSILGSFLGTGTTAFAGGGANYSADTGGLGAYNVSPYAKGGVFADSPSLSAYSGSVVNKPTMFAFARGAGVMGEAGPEAIMPLKRGPDGKLGVQMSGAGAAGGISIVTNVNIDNGGGASSSTSASGDDKAARQFADQINGMIQQKLVKEMRPGGLFWKQRNGVGA